MEALVLIAAMVRAGNTRKPPAPSVFTVRGNLMLSI